MSEKPVQVLLVEDNPGDARLVWEALAEAGPSLFNLLLESTLAAGLARLEKEIVDVILLDLNLPDSSGLDTFSQVHAGFPQVPILLLTGLADDALADTVVRAGAQDYLLKGQFTGSLLARSIRYAIERKHNQELLRSNEQHLAAIFEGVQDAIFVESVDGRILDVNRAACEMYGYSHAQFLTKTVDDLLPSGEYMVAFNPDHPADFPSHPVETVNLRANGQPFPIEINVRLQIIRGEDIYFVVGRDITGRKRTERASLLMSDTQRQIAQLDTVADIFHLVGKNVQELIGAGYVGITMLDEQAQAMYIDSLYGLGSVYASLLKIFKADPSKMTYPMQDMTAEELAKFRSGKLEEFAGGLYHLLVRKLPKKLCQAAEKQIHLRSIHTMGFVSQGLHFGGLTILATGDIAPYKIMIETIVNQATIAIKRLKAEEALHGSEQQYRELFENAVLAIFKVTLDGNIISVNPRFAELFGYASPADVLASIENSAQLFADPQRRAEILKMQLADPGRTNFENLYRRKDGSTFTGSLTVRSVTGSRGQAAFLEGFIEDISARKQAEAELQANRAAEQDFASRLAVLSEVTNELSTAKDFDLLCRRAVELGRERFGFDRLSILLLADDHTTLQGTFGVDEQGRYTDERDQHFDIIKDYPINAVFQGQVPLLRRENVPLSLRERVVGQGTHVAAGLWNGETILGYLSLDNLLRQRPFSDRDCELIRLFASALGHLISLKRLQEGLHVSEENYRLLFELSPDAIAVYRDGRIIFVNPAALKLMGASTSQELLGKSAMDFVHPDYRQLVIERMRRQAVEGRPVPTLDEKFFRLDGSAIDVDVTAAPIRYQGAMASMVIIRDITDRKQAEEQVRQQMSELQRWYNLTLDRETRALELKHEINELLRRLNEPPRYPSAEE